MKPISSVACCALLGVLATIGCSGDSVSAPTDNNATLSSGKPRTYVGELLPLPVGAASSEGVAVNRKGQVVGLVDGKAVRWDPGAAPVELGVVTGHESSYPLGISDGGDAVGGSIPPQTDAHIPFHVVRWPASGGIEDLGDMCCDAIAAAAISGQGEIAWVGAATQEGPQASFGLKLLRHGALTAVEFPDEAFRIGLGVRINDRGTVGAGGVVWSSHTGFIALGPGLVTITGINSGGDIVAETEGGSTLYPSKGDPVLLADLDPVDINAAGVIIGRTSDGARLRYADGTIAELPNPAGFGAGTVSPDFVDINDAGIVVGTASGRIGGEQVKRAAIWRPVPGNP